MGGRSAALRIRGREGTGSGLELEVVQCMSRRVLVRQGKLGIVEGSEGVLGLGEEGFSDGEQVGEARITSDCLLPLSLSSEALLVVGVSGADRYHGQASPCPART